MPLDWFDKSKDFKYLPLKPLSFSSRIFSLKIFTISSFKSSTCFISNETLKTSLDGFGYTFSYLCLIIDFRQGCNMQAE